ncbi:hypothetical protein FBZ83_104349 [Azospirillum brasilense]|uniref:Uncharacterized protein n=1 Tax=Azospirillum brasilense TaxID=192 RepID=A0A560CJU8_AZOBR|nr:hypothetical protein [Azospirillum brasilense]MBK3735401.1 hypothetical protein [Azospirillum brasilense]TWA85077.1 hypothetical protein FBZ83_104349 [Azospirillum brasilense]
MSTDKTPDHSATALSPPLPDLSDLERQKAEIEAIQAQMMDLRARIDTRLDERRPTIDVVPVHLDEPAPPNSPAAIRHTE